MKTTLDQPVPYWPTSPDPEPAPVSLRSEWAIRRPDGTFWRSPVDRLTDPDSTEPTTFDSRRAAETALRELVSEVTHALGHIRFQRPTIVVRAIRTVVRAEGIR
ncbi:hypothetical protein [Nocardia sp. NPDC003963]